jgi:hypothetical protein
MTSDMSSSLRYRLEEWSEKFRSEPISLLKTRVGSRIRYQSDLICSGDKIWYHWWKANGPWRGNKRFPNLQFQGNILSFLATLKRGPLRRGSKRDLCRSCVKLSTPELSEMAHPTEPHFIPSSEWESLRWDRSFVCLNLRNDPS